MDEKETVGKSTLYPNLMELHRVRFIGLTRQAIQCLSFKDDGAKLALSRDDGSLEVWASHSHGWVKELWIPGRTNTSIQALQWCGERLFTGCLSGEENSYCIQ